MADDTEGNQMSEDELRSARELADARMQAQPFGPMTPEAAWSWVEWWCAKEKARLANDELMRKRRDQQLLTPVEFTVGDKEIALDRLVYEKIWDIFATAQSYGDDQEEMAVGEIIELLAKAGVVTVNDG